MPLYKLINVLNQTLDLRIYTVDYECQDMDLFVGSVGVARECFPGTAYDVIHVHLNDQVLEILVELRRKSYA